MGLVAENSRTTQRLMLPPPILTTSGVFAKFRDIARLTGSTVSGAGRSPPYPRPSAPHLGDPKACVWQEGFWLDYLGLDHFSFACERDLSFLPLKTESTY